jgi:CRISP-associated protein Cas1
MMSLDQPELPLPAPPLPVDQPHLPARMVNEVVYCPRLAYLEWVQGEWAESADTVEGRFAHRRVDRQGAILPAGGEGLRIHARSVTLASDRLGLIARIDLVEGEDGIVTPVDYKRGRRPHVAQGAWEPERVQLCVQGLLLDEHGYGCKEGILYFAESRERVRVSFDEGLRARTLEAAAALRLTAASGRIPPPLEDSPKCPRCSLVGICLPDEVTWLSRGGLEPRPLAARRHDTLPLYVQAHDARIGKKGEVLEIRRGEEAPVVARLAEISQLVVMGQAQVTTAALHELMRREIPVSWHSTGGWFLGHTVGTGHKNVELRTAQYHKSHDERACLHLARSLVAAKIRNSRTLVRRNTRGAEPPTALLAKLKRDAEEAARAPSLASLLGIEGAAGARHFGALGELLKPGDGFAFDVAGRNRRPPRDPVNALLSFCYALLTRAITVTVAAVGLDPYRGLYHQPRYGRPALALDLMEPFRPLIADSAVLTLINNGEIRPGHFVRAAGACALNPEGRKRTIAAFERRLAQEITHPLFGYRIDYRRLLEVEARLFGRHLMGEVPWSPLVTR